MDGDGAGAGNDDRSFILEELICPSESSGKAKQKRSSTSAGSLGSGLDTRKGFMEERQGSGGGSGKAVAGTGDGGVLALDVARDVADME